MPDGIIEYIFHLRKPLTPHCSKSKLEKEGHYVLNFTCLWKCVHWSVGCHGLIVVHILLPTWDLPWGDIPYIHLSIFYTHLIQLSMFLDSGRKPLYKNPEYPEWTHAYTRRRCKLNTERLQDSKLEPFCCEATGLHSIYVQEIKNQFWAV